MRTVYEVRTTAGEVIAEHVRVEQPDGTKRMYWQRPGGDPRAGLMGLSTPDLPLYGSENVRTFQDGQTVVVTEGERACEALWSLGIDALGTVTGASASPGDAALVPLLPFGVVLWPDHDEAGEAHMARVATSLLRRGGRVRRLNWGTQKGDDAADFVARGGTSVTAELLIQAAETGRPEVTVPGRVTRPSYEDRDDDWRVDRARSHLAQVVEHKLGPPVKRMGRSLFWRCPFHQDGTPSFKVDLREPFFRCFGCDARGDVFDFLKRSEGVAFKDALRELAPAPLVGMAAPW